jgi:hypothetical protein
MTPDRPRSAREYWQQRKAREARYGKRSLNVRQRPITELYCFCGMTPLWAVRCDTCGKPPYTD